MTVTCASTMPGAAKTNLMTLSSIAEPSGVLKNTSKAAPSATGDTTMGRSSRLSTMSLPGKLEREIA